MFPDISEIFRNIINKFLELEEIKKLIELAKELAELCREAKSGDEDKHRQRFNYVKLLGNTLTTALVAGEVFVGVPLPDIISP